MLGAYRYKYTEQESHRRETVCFIEGILYCKK